MWVLLELHNSEELSMRTITTIGLDIAKSVFQVHQSTKSVARYDHFRRAARKNYFSVLT